MSDTTTLEPISAAGLVRAALYSARTDSTFTGKAERSRIALQQAERVIEKASTSGYQRTFEEFAAKLTNILQATVRESTGKTRSAAVQTENLWQAFYGLRVSKLVDLWKQFLVSIGEDLDPLVQQYVNQKMYEDLIKSLSSVRPSATAATKPSLTPDEENIVRYASGYVPMALIKRFETHVTERSISIVECLSAMAVDGEGTSIRNQLSTRFCTRSITHA